MKFGINLLTGVGAGLSTISIAVASNGNIRAAWMLMGVGMLIDWIDGSLVRYFDLESVLPEYDGRQLDALADYVTYVIAPVCVAWASGVLEDTVPGLVTGVFVCAVSGLQFVRAESKTDRAFLGWPSYWNFLYFYGWGLGMARISPEWMMVLSWVFGFATLARIPFPYPTKFPLQQVILTVSGTLWGIVVTGFLLVPGVPKIYLALSLLFPLYYLALPLVYYEELMGE